MKITARLVCCYQCLFECENLQTCTCYHSPAQQNNSPCCAFLSLTPAAVQTANSLQPGRIGVCSKPAPLGEHATRSALGDLGDSIGTKTLSTHTSWRTSTNPHLKVYDPAKEQLADDVSEHVVLASVIELRLWVSPMLVLSRTEHYSWALPALGTLASLWELMSEGYKHEKGHPVSKPRVGLAAPLCGHACHPLVTEVVIG